MSNKHLVIMMFIPSICFGDVTANNQSSSYDVETYRRYKSDWNQIYTDHGHGAFPSDGSDLWPGLSLIKVYRQAGKKVKVEWFSLEKQEAITTVWFDDQERYSISENKHSGERCSHDYEYQVKIETCYSIETGKFLKKKYLFFKDDKIELGVYLDNNHEIIRYTVHDYSKLERLRYTVEDKNEFSSRIRKE